MTHVENQRLNARQLFPYSDHSSELSEKCLNSWVSVCSNEKKVEGSVDSKRNFLLPSEDDWILILTLATVLLSPNQTLCSSGLAFGACIEALE